MLPYQDELLLAPEEMSEADRRSSALIPSARLMENAGRAVARAAIRLFRPVSVLVACGPGNNGGDGYVAARLLQRRGWPVVVASVAPPRPGTDAELMARRWRGPIVPLSVAAAGRVGLVIDGLFGAGASRPLDQQAADCLAAASELLAIDLPSGLNGRTGAPIGTVRAADATVTFVRAKPGHLLLPGRSLCGRLLVADIGMPESVVSSVAGPSTVRRNGPALWALRTRSDMDNKYSRGTVSVCGGAKMSGAARLAAQAARRAGAGLVRISAPGRSDVYRNAEPGLIVDGSTLEQQLEDNRRLVWVCGPGLEEHEARDILPGLLARSGLGTHAIRSVIDGGALTLASGNPRLLAGGAILTPHAGEFVRVFGRLGEDRIEAVRAAARATKAVVILKGADSIIAGPDGRVVVNEHATPALATAGSGDTLAGIAAAMLAEGLEPFEAACASVWLHGEAGRLAGAGLIAEDLADFLPEAMRRAQDQRHLPMDRDPRRLRAA